MKRLFAIILMIVSIAMLANAGNDDKSFKCENKTYSSTGRVTGSSIPVATGFTWKDSKGKKYPIYISESGSCYTIRVSNKTGKEYKSYMKPEISQDICNRLGKVYKSKKK